MFFIMGITQGRKSFDYNQMMVCEHCGSYGRYQVYMTYMWIQKQSQKMRDLFFADRNNQSSR